MRRAVRRVEMETKRKKRHSLQEINFTTHKLWPRKNGGCLNFTNVSRRIVEALVVCFFLSSFFLHNFGSILPFARFKLVWLLELNSFIPRIYKTESCKRIYCFNVFWKFTKFAIFRLDLLFRNGTIYSFAKYNTRMLRMYLWISIRSYK